MTHRRTLLLAAIAFFSAASSPTLAITYNWTNPAGGSWSDLANWSPSVIPLAGNTALFNLASPSPGYTVSLDNSPTDPASPSIPNDILTFTLPPSTTRSFNTLSLAGSPSQNASLTLTGGTFNFLTSILASAGSATLNVSPNTTLIAPFLSSGSAGGSATLNVTGPNAQLQSTSLQLGNLGPATLNITSGAIVTGSTSSSLLNGNAIFASNSSTVSVTVDGPGSLLSYDSLQLATGLVGPFQPSSSASLTIRNGAQVVVNSFTSAAATGSTSSISVDGPSSTLYVNGTLQLAFVAGSASLSLTNGATLGSQPGPLAPTTSLTLGPAASLSVSSGSSANTNSATLNPGSSITIGSDTTATSQFSCHDSLNLYSNASVTVNSGGLLTVGTPEGAGAIHLAGGTVNITSFLNFFHGTITGAGTVSGHLDTTTCTIAPDGTLNLTSGTPGAHSVLRLIGSNLQLDISSPTTFDRITSPNTVHYGGALSISLNPSYSPSLGDSFDLLDFYARDSLSTFSTLSLPPLPPGLTWDTSSLYSTGTLSIALPEPSLLAASCLALPLLPRRRR